MKLLILLLSVCTGLVVHNRCGAIFTTKQNKRQDPSEAIVYVTCFPGVGGDITRTRTWIGNSLLIGGDQVSQEREESGPLGISQGYHGVRLFFGDVEPIEADIVDQSHNSEITRYHVSHLPTRVGRAGAAVAAAASAT